jgi:hypothetical protein
MIQNWAAKARMYFFSHCSATYSFAPLKYESFQTRRGQITSRHQPIVAGSDNDDVED